jgi:hypothetical protein
MIDATPRGRAVFEETGKWPSEQAKGTERDPDNVAPLVVYLSSDAAAGVNGQAFHSFGFGYTLMAQPQAIRRLDGSKRFTPAELAKLFPSTLGADLAPAPGTTFGREIDKRPAEEWKDLGGGSRFWQWSREER